VGFPVRLRSYKNHNFGSADNYFFTDAQFSDKYIDISCFSVYGNTTEESDWDFILIVKDPPHFELEKEKRTPKRNVDEMEKRFLVFELLRVNGMLVPLSDWKSMLMEHRHEALECLYLPKKHVCCPLLHWKIFLSRPAAFCETSRNAFWTLTAP
jgi:hypothetical protein